MLEYSSSPSATPAIHNAMRVRPLRTRPTPRRDDSFVPRLRSELRGLPRPDTATDATDIRPSIGMLRRQQGRIGRRVALGVLVNAAVEPIAGIETGGNVFLGINFGADDVGCLHF